MDNNLQRLTEVVQKTTNGAIVLSNNPSADAVASGTALYLALHKMGKNVSLVCAGKVSYNLTASDKFQSQMVNSGDNLVISFPYSEGAIDKVDYNIQGTNFNLIVTPRSGFPKLDSSQVKFSYTGGNLDFVIVIDAPTLNSLGTIYTDNEKLFQGREIINIDRHLTNSFYGTVNYVNKATSSISEMILKLLQQFGVELDRDIATNLYAGIAASTNNFTSYSVTADTFESVAALLRMGAIKKIIRKSDQTNQNSFNMNQYSPPPISNSKPIEGVEKEPLPQSKQTPQDWLKPKIFKGGGGLV